MRYSLFCFVLLFFIFVLGCDSKYPNASSRRQRDESKAEAYLLQARSAFAQSDFKAAKEYIEVLRDSCRYALETREQAILLMDSIDLFETSNELKKVDSILRVESQQPSLALRESYNNLSQKVKFYQRKLQHDLQQRKQHD